jgi:hypothetical protein
VTQQKASQLVSAPSEEPTWKQRAVERSTRAAKLRAEQRVQRFLDAAQAILLEKGNTDFIAQSSEIPGDANGHPLSADEVWDFCTKGFARG